MVDFDSRLRALLGPQPEVTITRPRPFCAVVQPCAPTGRDWLHEQLLAPAHREAFFGLVDEVGLVVIAGVHADPTTYRDVRGRSSRGRLSQGEYFHHDGCSGPVKPRVVEIRCPHQEVGRNVPTAVAPFPETVYAMLRALPADLAASDPIGRWREQLDAEGGLAEGELDMVQGVVTRAVRRSLSATGARGYFTEVDRRCEAYDAPWSMGDSRFIANANPTRTMQHRRAYGPDHAAHGPNGKLLKRWPADDGVLP